MLPVNVGDIVDDNIFNKWGERPSGPVDLLVSRVSSCFRTPSSDMIYQ